MKKIVFFISFFIIAYFSYGQSTGISGSVNPAATKAPADSAKKDDYLKFRLALNGGYSYALGKIPDEYSDGLREYAKELRSGFHFGGDAAYYLSKFFGIGFKCYLFKTSNSRNGISLQLEDGTTLIGEMGDNIKTSFIGATFATRIATRDIRNSVILNASIGYMGYSNDFVLIEKFMMKGKTLGVAFDVGYDVGISKKFAIGVQISCVVGALSKYTINGTTGSAKVVLPKGEYQSVSRLDFTIGIRFNN